MAAVTNTYISTSSNTNKEQLSDVVSRITPEETPIYSMVPKGKLTGTHPEWVVDELDAPADNAQSEGDDYTFGATTNPDKIGNYSQIYRKSWSLSATQEASDDAGKVLKRKEQKLKKSIALRKDVEFSLVSNRASLDGNTRRSGGLPSFIETNASRGSGGANGGFNTSTKLTVAATDGTKRAFTKTLLDTTMQSVYTSGGNASHLVASPYVKSVFVTFMSDSNVASFRYAVSKGGKENTIVATADFYEGPFGKIMIQPNRVMTTEQTARNAFLLDTSLLSFDWLRKIQEDKNVAKTGDAEKGVIIGEGCLRVKNEAGLGVIADIFGLDATT
jgi:hypothetical protein